MFALCGAPVVMVKSLYIEEHRGRDRASQASIPARKVIARVIRLRFLTMRERLEEDPDEESDVESPAASTTATAPLSTVSSGVREFEYRTELVSDKQILDGKTLAEQLTKASTDGWDLVEIVAAGERHAILLRRAKRTEKTSRPVGFTPRR
jgi:hypothetical protein